MRRTDAGVSEPVMLKILGQSKPAATTLTAIDTVPAVVAHVVSSIVVCNQHASIDDHFRVSVAVAGEADALKQYLYYDQLVPAQESFVATIGITLATTDVLRVYTTNGTSSFNLFGTEEAA